MLARNPSSSRGYKDLQAYQKAQELVSDVIAVTAGYPKNEMYGAVSQSRRAALSVVSNIAEGYRRNSRRDFIHFLKIALGSAGELDAQLAAAHNAGWIPQSDYNRLAETTDTVSRWLYRLMESIERRIYPSSRPK
jgi:four helix bundle protein